MHANLKSPELFGKEPKSILSGVRALVPCWMQVRSPRAGRTGTAQPLCALQHSPANPAPPSHPAILTHPQPCSALIPPCFLPLPSTLLVFPFCCPRVGTESSVLLCLQPLSLRCHLSAPSRPFPAFGGSVRTQWTKKKKKE